MARLGPKRGLLEYCGLAFRAHESQLGRDVRESTQRRRDAEASLLAHRFLLSVNSLYQAPTEVGMMAIIGPPVPAYLAVLPPRL